MLEDYKNIQSNTKSLISWGRVENLCFFLIGLACGVCLALIICFDNHDVEDPMPVPVATKEPTAKEPSTVETPAPSVSPTFDFYQILPNATVNTSEWETNDIETQQADVSEQKLVIKNHEGTERASKPSSKAVKSNVYILQIGSFKEYETAVIMQDKIDLMGLTSDVQRVVIHGKDVRYRVRIGPYKEAGELARVRQKLEKHNLSYIILRLQ